MRRSIDAKGGSAAEQRESPPTEVDALDALERQVCHQNAGTCVLIERATIKRLIEQARLARDLGRSLFETDILQRRGATWSTARTLGLTEEWERSGGAWLKTTIRATRRAMLRKTGLIA